MSDFKNLVGKFIVGILLISSLFSYIIIVQEDNNAVDPIKNNEVFNESFNDLIEVIDYSTNEAEEKYDVFNSETPRSGFSSIVLFGIISVGKTFSSIIFGTFAAIIKLPLIILGISQTIYNLILTWLIITVVVSVWLLYKLGG